jgi:hypothetical protein
MLIVLPQDTAGKRHALRAPFGNATEKLHIFFAEILSVAVCRSPAVGIRGNKDRRRDGFA